MRGREREKRTGEGSSVEDSRVQVTEETNNGRSDEGDDI